MDNDNDEMTRWWGWWAQAGFQISGVQANVLHMQRRFIRMTDVPRPHRPLASLNGNVDILRITNQARELEQTAKATGGGEKWNKRGITDNQMLSGAWCNRTKRKKSATEMGTLRWMRCSNKNIVFFYVQEGTQFKFDLRQNQSISEKFLE